MVEFITSHKVEIWWLTLLSNGWETFSRNLQRPTRRLKCYFATRHMRPDPATAARKRNFSRTQSRAIKNGREFLARARTHPFWSQGNSTHPAAYRLRGCWLAPSVYTTFKARHGWEVCLPLFVVGEAQSPVAEGQMGQAGPLADAPHPWKS